jgi:LysR family transcriptional regulator, hydrogen peroxide-inducible genes activator
MEMHQVRYFCALCEELNFSRAAARCNVSQPALTRAIMNLEQEFGGRLFHRERSNTRLSELGRAIKPYLEQLRQQAALAMEQARQFLSIPDATLKLGIMCTIAPDAFIRFISEMRAAHPHITLEIVDSNAEHLEERLITGDLDIAIYCRPDAVRDERLHYQPLFREQMMIAVNHTHRLANFDAIKVTDLDGENYLERINCEFGVTADAVFTKLGVNGETIYRSDRDDWVLAMAAAGLGYAFVPSHVARRARGLVSLPLIEPEFWREVSLITVRGRPHSPPVGALVQMAMKTVWLGEQAIAVRSHAWEETELP